MADAEGPGDGRDGISGGEGPAGTQVAQAGAAAFGDPIGAVRQVTGQVLIVHRDGTSEPAAPGLPVFANDIVATGPEGAVEVLFLDGTTFSLGGNGQMRLDSLIFDPAGSNNGLDATVVKGSFVFITGQVGSAEGEGVSIDTPAGTIGIRGTSGGVAQDPRTGVWIFTLFRDPDGTLSRFTVTNPAGTRLLDQEFETTQAASRQVAPAQTVVLTPEQAASVFSGALQMLQEQFPDLQTPEQRGELENIIPEAGEEAFTVDPGDILAMPVALSELYGLDLALTLADLLEKLGLEGTDVAFVQFGDSLVPLFYPDSPNTPLIDSDVTTPNQTRTTATVGQYVGLTVEPNSPILDGAITFSLVSDADGLFAIDPQTGQVTVTDTGIAPGTYIIIVRAVDDDGDSVDTAFPITVTPNALPVPAADKYSVDEDGTLAVSAAGGVLANDKDADGDPLSATVAAGPANGTLELNADGSFSYTPDEDFNGVDSFTYTVSDEFGGSKTGTVTLTVDAANDVPVAQDDSYDAGQGGTLVVAAKAGVLANDSDTDGDALTVTLDTGPEHGELSLNDDGSFTYTPDAGYDGPDEFTYTVEDGRGGADTGTVTIDVADADPAPADDLVQTADAARQTIDIVIILDRSSSMENNPGVAGFSTRLELARAAIAALFEAYGSVADLNIQIVDFADTAASSGWLGSAEAANAYLAGLVAGSGTNYTAAIEEAMAAYAGAPAADKTEIYFLSDGAPSAGTSLAATGNVGIWENFLSNPANHIENAFAVGIGTGIAENDPDLADVAFPNGDPANPVVVTDESELIDTLVGTVANPVSGNVLLNDDFGPDGKGNGGAGLLTITVDGVTYTFGANQITNDANLPVIAGATLVVITGLGGTLEFHFDNGDFTYTPPDIDSPESEQFDYTIVDGDGSEVGATLQIDISDSGVVVLDPNTVIGTDAGDSLAGAAGSVDDVMSGGKGADSIAGGAGNDHIQGGADSDSLSGGAGADVLIGGAGNDTLEGGAGADVLIGGAGNDTLILTDIAGFATVEGGDSGAVNLAASGGDVLAFDGGLDLTALANDRIGGIETISMLDGIGGAGADTLALGAGDVIDVGAGQLDPAGELTLAPAVRVDGDKGDVLNLEGGGWQQVEAGGVPQGYSLYLHDGPAAGVTPDAYVLVQATVTVTTD